MPLSQNQKDLLDKTWQSVRPSIGKELLAESELVPVPNISQANYFDLFSVFVKSKSESLGQKTKNSLADATGSSYHVIGDVAKVVQLDKTDLDRLLDNVEHTAAEDIDQSKKWEGYADCGLKVVHLTVAALNKFLIPQSLREEEIYLKKNIPELVGAKSIYIITEVMKANGIKAMVTGKDHTEEKITVFSIPIGFGYSKFRLSPEGLVAEQIESKPSFNSKWDVVIDRLSEYLNDM